MALEHICTGEFIILLDMSDTYGDLINDNFIIALSAMTIQHALLMNLFEQVDNKVFYHFKGKIRIN